jgi:hypothetical protein
VLVLDVRDRAIALRTPHLDLPQLPMFPLSIYKEDRTNSINCPIIYSLEFIKRYNLALEGGVVESSLRCVRSKGIRS